MKGKGSGWRNESRRHSLARRSIRTTGTTNRYNRDRFISNGVRRHLDFDWDNPNWDAIKNELFLIEDSIRMPNSDTRIEDLPLNKYEIIYQIIDGLKKVGVDEDIWDLDGIIEDFGIYAWVEMLLTDVCDNAIGKPISLGFETPSLYEFIKSREGY